MSLGRISHLLRADRLPSYLLPCLSPGTDVSLGRIIYEIEAQHQKRCDKDPPHGGCNTLTRVTKTLWNVPDVFTLLLAWEQDVSSEEIAGTMDYIDTVLKPQEIFTNGNCPPEIDALTYALHGMFCYYGQHYFAFIYRPEEKAWVMFDDATVAPVGPWPSVVAKCRAGRIQPSVLFYQRQR